MKCKRVLNVFIYVILFLETLIIIFSYMFHRDIKLSKISDETYEIKFRTKNGATIFFETKQDNVSTLNFTDENNNYVFVSFENEQKGSFCFIDADLNYAIDNRPSEDENFLFQRLEHYKDDYAFYNIKYDTAITIDELQIPTIEDCE